MLGFDSYEEGRREKKYMKPIKELNKLLFHLSSYIVMSWIKAITQIL